MNIHWLVNLIFRRLIVVILLIGVTGTALHAGETGPRDVYRKALETFQQGDYETTRHIAQQLLDQRPPDTVARRAHYLLGRSLYEQEQQPVTALQSFYRVISGHSPDNLGDDALYFTAEILRTQLDQPQSSLQYLQAVVDHFPGGDYRDRAVQRLTKLRQKVDAEPTSYNSLEEIPRPHVKLNFEKVDIKQLVATYSDLAGKNFVYRPDIEGTVTLISRDGIPVNHLFTVFVSLLETRGYTVTKEGSVYRVQTTEQALERGVEFGSGETGLSSRLFSTGNLSEDQVKQVLKTLLPDQRQLVFLPELDRVLVSSSPSRLKEVDRVLMGLRAMKAPTENQQLIRFVPRYAKAGEIQRKLTDLLPGFLDEDDYQVIADEQTNVLLMVARREDAEFLRRMARRLDQDVVDRLKMKVFRLQHADEQQVVKKLKQLLEVLPDDYTSENIQVVPDDRQKAVIVSSVSDKAFRIVERVIADLDRASPSTPQRVRVYRLQHADEQKIASTLNNMVETLPGQFPEGKIKIIPDERQRAVVVSAESKQVFPVVKRVIDQLDREDARQPRKYHVYKVRNSKAGPLAEKLNFLYKKKQDTIRVTADEQTNSLVISAPAPEYEGIKKVIKKLDSPKKRILIDAYIVEASSEKVRELGIEWGVEGRVTDRDLTLETQFGQGEAVPPGANPGQGLIAGIMDESGQRFLTALHALEQEDDFEILSTAHLVANENEEANLSVGDVIPILTQTQTTPEGSVNRSFDFQNVGIDLDIVPTLSSEKTVSLDVSQKIQEIEEASLGGVVGAPTRRNRSIQTRVSIPENLTLVLGGVLQKTTSKNYQSVPILGDIPILGYLFQSRGSNKQRTNLLVFLRPRILGTSGELQEATRRLQEEQNLRQRAPDSMNRYDTAAIDTNTKILPASDSVPHKGDTVTRPEPLPTRENRESRPQSPDSRGDTGIPPNSAGTREDTAP